MRTLTTYINQNSVAARFNMVNTAPRELVLICTDSSEHSLRAFNWYHNHFHRSEFIVGLVHIYTYPEDQKKLQEVLASNNAVTRKYEELCAQRGITSVLYTEEKKQCVGQTICKIAQDNNASCIVMGQRGLGGLKRAMYGSVSDFVLHHAAIPVLIVPPQKGGGGGTLRFNET